jgi:hypothetical protein
MPPAPTARDPLVDAAEVHTRAHGRDVAAETIHSRDEPRIVLDRREERVVDVDCRIGKTLGDHAFPRGDGRLAIAEQCVRRGRLEPGAPIPIVLGRAVDFENFFEQGPCTFRPAGTDVEIRAERAWRDARQDAAGFGCLFEFLVD